MQFTTKITLYAVHCTIVTLYAVHCTTITLYAVHCTIISLFVVYCTIIKLYAVHCTVVKHYAVHCTVVTLYAVHCTQITYWLWVGKCETLHACVEGRTELFKILKLNKYCVMATCKRRKLEEWKKWAILPTKNLIYNRNGKKKIKSLKSCKNIHYNFR